MYLNMECLSNYAHHIRQVQSLNETVTHLQKIETSFLPQLQQQSEIQESALLGNVTTRRKS